MGPIACRTFKEFTPKSAVIDYGDMVYLQYQQVRGEVV